MRLLIAYWLGLQQQNRMVMCLLLRNKFDHFEQEGGFFDIEIVARGSPVHRID